MYKRVGVGVYLYAVLVGVYNVFSGCVQAGRCRGVSARSFSGCVQAVLSGVTVFVKDNTVMFLFVTD